MEFHDGTTLGSLLGIARSGVGLPEGAVTFTPLSTALPSVTEPLDQISPVSVDFALNVIFPPKTPAALGWNSLLIRTVALIVLVLLLSFPADVMRYFPDPWV